MLEVLSFDSLSTDLYSTSFKHRRIQINERKVLRWISRCEMNGWRDGVGDVATERERVREHGKMREEEDGSGLF